MLNALWHELRLVAIALQFFTRVPVPQRIGFEPEWLNASARHFPLVGFFVGVIAALVLAVGSQVLGIAIGVWLSIAATVWLTGAFHEDGLADTCDALGGAVSRERALEIMKDSRIGSYGAVALVLVLGLKAATLSALPMALAVPALLLAHTASRAAAVLLIRVLPYAGEVSLAKAKPLAQRVSFAGLVVALAWVLAVGAGLLAVRWAWWPYVAIGLAGVALGTLVCGRWFHRRLGGITGDTLGATQQITELLCLLGWVLALRWA
ncbi:adenosylcobinamide-GDP ribazoletransferase [Rhizobacter sp. SG703]|uniref:adenosylcobinamide-GDP ribazoletransferase n=1 Tax=Rhizobacter sp. SG703 TaxID=2587140 RepID=UPI0017A5B047|nr:adenosylcobinamide-GDP ribazoletransferase [Rhizobacter sp. SG703]NKI97421.1 adenosylcobinamide-GDP ribazoletransferase [Rhizobacter sp. SG703]